MWDEYVISRFVVCIDYNIHFIIFKWAKYTLSSSYDLLTMAAFHVIYLAMSIRSASVRGECLTKLYSLSRVPWTYLVYPLKMYYTHFGRVDKIHPISQACNRQEPVFSVHDSASLFCGKKTVSVAIVGLPARPLAGGGHI